MARNDRTLPGMSVNSMHDGDNGNGRVAEVLNQRYYYSETGNVTGFTILLIVIGIVWAFGTSFFMGLFSSIGISLILNLFALWFAVKYGRYSWKENINYVLQIWLLFIAARWFVGEYFTGSILETDTTNIELIVSELDTGGGKVDLTFEEDISLGDFGTINFGESQTRELDFSDSNYPAPPPVPTVVPPVSGQPQSGGGAPPAPPTPVPTPDMTLHNRQTEIAQLVQGGKFGDAHTLAQQTYDQFKDEYSYNTIIAIENALALHEERQGLPTANSGSKSWKGDGEDAITRRLLVGNSWEIIGHGEPVKNKYIMFDCEKNVYIRQLDGFSKGVDYLVKLCLLDQFGANNIGDQFIVKE